MWNSTPKGIKVTASVSNALNDFNSIVNTLCKSIGKRTAKKPWVVEMPVSRNLN
jgi:hypothetical protein